MDIEKFKMGWLIVAFDLPVGSKKQRKAAYDFREWLNRLVTSRLSMGIVPPRIWNQGKACA